jgi:hypothetical protein
MFMRVILDSSGDNDWEYYFLPLQREWNDGVGRSGSRSGRQCQRSWLVVGSPAACCSRSSIDRATASRYRGLALDPLAVRCRYNELIRSNSRKTGHRWSLVERRLSCVVYALEFAWNYYEPKMLSLKYVMNGMRHPRVRMKLDIIFYLLLLWQHN